MTTGLGVMFAGQGAQHPGMGLELCRTSPAAAEIYSRADQLLGWKISELCFNGPQEELTSCAACQPAIYVTSMADFAARKEASPDFAAGICAGAGLSLGELAAMAAAGVYSFEDGLRIVAKRGQLMDELCRRTSGAMAAVIGADENDVNTVCAEHGIDVANYNCPGQLIISGASEAVDAASAALAPKAMKVTRLEVAGAYHSRLMKDAGESFRSFIDGFDFAAPAFTLFHNVTGEAADGDAALLKDRLAQQIYSPVRWEACARGLTASCTSLFELGPGKVLAGLLRRIDRRFPVESSGL
jgi:[acyl-carrier-protein] S-malonyltransferase